jgi:glycogen synthase
MEPEPLLALLRKKRELGPVYRPRVLFVTSEFDDLVRVGGLAAVSAALPRALASGCEMRVLLPGYRDRVALPSILTIHNLAYQGLFAKHTLSRIGAPEEAFTINGVEFFNRVSFLKAGLVYATHLTTVSQTYAREITTPALGCGLDGLLRSRAERAELTGILNGIDESWDPRTCPELIVNFEAGDWERRERNSEHVRRNFGLGTFTWPAVRLGL